MNELGVDTAVERVPTSRRKFWSVSGQVQVDAEVHHLLVDGVRLDRAVDVDGWGGVSPLRPWPVGWTVAVEHLQRLLGTSPPDVDGWTGLLTCPACGDAACGALAVRLDVQQDVVTWRDASLRWPTDKPGLVQDVDGWGSRPRTTFTFEREKYEGVLRPLLAHYRGLQRAAAEHRS